jgi:hypothetical protein
MPPERRSGVYASTRSCRLHPQYSCQNAGLRWRFVPTTVEFSLALQIACEMAARWIPLVIRARNTAPPPTTFQRLACRGKGRYARRPHHFASAPLPDWCSRSPRTVRRFTSLRRLSRSCPTRLKPARPPRLSRGDVDALHALRGGEFAPCRIRHVSGRKRSARHIIPGSGLG